jgi:hypothetical protein
VAQDHLSSEAAKALAGYLDGLTLTAIATDADTYRGVWTRDMGFIPSNIDEARPPWLKSFDFSTPLNIAPYSHMITVDKEFRCYRTDNLDGEYINNIAYYVDILTKELKAHASEMDSFERYKAIALIVHFVGDMHCPVHIRLHDDTTLGIYKVMYGNKKTDFHRLWDAGLVGATHPWSYSDLAQMLDTSTEAEIAEICKGDVFDWGEEAARIATPLRNYKPDEAINKQEFMHKHLHTGELLIRNAGYRLAKVLNEIFE